jgi:hypothetical protein
MAYAISRYIGADPDQSGLGPDDSMRLKWIDVPDWTHSREAILATVGGTLLLLYYILRRKFMVGGPNRPPAEVEAQTLAMPERVVHKHADLPGSGTVPLAPLSSPRKHSTEEVLALVGHRTAIAWLFFVNLLVLGSTMRPGAQGLFYILSAINGIFALVVARALKKGPGAVVIIAVLALVPVVNFFVLAAEGDALSRVLKARGLKVGVMGVSKAELTRWKTEPAGTQDGLRS